MTKAFLQRDLTGYVRHAEPSAILSMDDEPNMPSQRLLDLSLAAIRAAMSCDLSNLSKRLKAPPFYPDVWPGEHYKLLAGFVEVTKPKSVVEIGTATGLSALAMKTKLPPQSTITTFDIVPWKQFGETVLEDSDFEDGSLVQSTDDLSELSGLLEHESLLASTDLFFIDASKDGSCEPKLIENLKKIRFQKPPVVIFDDIRLLNMIKVWREIDYPKLDLTSFGHWSGTGVVDWTDSKIG